MIVACHQPNFVPHFGFFYKMSKADKFIILTQVQFEKNGYQNRYFLHQKEKWVTMPVEHGLEPIYMKMYTNGRSLEMLNTDFIFWVKDVLSIKTEIVKDIKTQSRSTQRLIDNIKFYGGTTYLTNPSAKDKYLDEQLMKDSGIEIEYCASLFDRMNILEMFDEYGIDGTRNKLNCKKELCGIN